MTRAVTIELTVEDAQAVRAWQRSKDSIAEFDKQGKKTTKTFNGMFAEQARGVANVAASFAGVGSVIGGIATAANLLRSEYDNLIQRQANAATSNLTFEQSLAQAVRSADGIFNAAEVRQKTLKLAEDAGITTTKAAGVVNSALTSTGVTNAAEADLAIESGRAAAIFAPELEVAGTEALAGIAASTAKRFDVTPRSVIGYMQRIGAQSNIRELAPLIENVAPVVSNLSEFGFSPEDSGALLAMLTQGIGDTTGEMSGTAAVNFAKSLRERFSRSDEFLTPSGQFDPIDAIDALRNDPKLRKAFLEGGEFFGKKFGKASLGKGKAIPTIEGLLRSDDSVQSRQFFGSRRAIGGFSKGEETYDRLVENVRSVTPVEQVDRILDSATSGVQANDLTAISSIIREKGKTFQQSIEDSALSQRIDGYLREFESDFGNDPLAAINSFQEQLSTTAKRLRRGTPEQTHYTTDMMGGVVPTGSIPARPATTREVELADRADSLSEKLERVESVVEVQVKVNNRPANADVRIAPASGRHDRLSSSPRSGGRQ